MSDEVKELRALLGKITPGPWVGNNWHVFTNATNLPAHRTFGYGCGKDFVCDLNDGEYHEYSDLNEQAANTDFIAAARNAMPGLLDAAAENARLRQNAAKWDRTGQATAQLENEAADRIAALQAEVAGLEHDIARHIEIASTECIARVEADDALTAANERIAVLENALSDARLVVEKWCWDQNNTQELIGPYLDPIDAALSTPLEDKP